jgi:diguanylate cyclase (GGDEF)-like protein/PAS domain S-box-containing protein
MNHVSDRIYRKESALFMSTISIEKIYKTKKDLLQESEVRYRRLFEAAQDGILILDAETGAITDVNPFMINLLGYSREEFIEKKLWQVGAFQDVQASKDAFLALQKDQYIRYKDLPLRAKDGHLISVEFVSNVYQAGNEKVIQCNIRDITEQKKEQDALIKSEAELREQSVRDHLTGLFNRRYMEETLKRELSRAARKGSPLGLIMLDVDNFKHFNDMWGHAAGDAVLSQLGRMLQKHFRGEDIPCRYGGDEFIFILPDASQKATYERATLICQRAKELQIDFGEQHLDSCTLSLGVAVFPEHGTTTVDILSSVDDALYVAKRRGRDQIVIASSP